MLINYKKEVVTTSFLFTEGVETDKQLLMLTEMGCHIFQGYYFSKPVPVSEFEEKYLV